MSPAEIRHTFLNFESVGDNAAMKIGILGGTGRMGSRLARGYLQAGHEIILGSRSPKKADQVATEMGDGVRGGSLQQSAEEGEMIVLAVGFRDAAGTVRAVRDALSGKIIVDITNPFNAIPPGRTSGIEENGKSAPEARWVAAYKTTFWKTLEPSAHTGRTKRDVLVCSDDQGARRAVMQLIEETGFRALDCGRLENARTLDLMVPLMIELDQRHSGDALSSWKFIDAGPV